MLCNTCHFFVSRGLLEKLYTLISASLGEELKSINFQNQTESKLVVPVT
jgi:hypothetical protein